MTFLHTQFLKIIIIIVFSIVLASAIFFASKFISISSPDTQKVSAYECGFDPYEDARNVFDVKFYVVAILFLIFDLETVYFFPWCISFSLLNNDGICYLLDFGIELVVGYIYALEMGALNWDNF